MRARLVGGGHSAGPFKLLRQAAILVAGTGLMALGVVSLFLPAPGVAMILGGLGILATEYTWARRWLDKGRSFATTARARFSRPARLAA